MDILNVVLGTLVGVVILVILAKLAQRRMFYPVPGRWPTTGRGEVSTLLRELEEVLAERAPDVLAALDPGLEPAGIDRLERQHGFRLTPALRALYGWRDGGAEGVALVPGHRFPPLGEVVERRQAMRQPGDTPWIGRVIGWWFIAHRLDWLDVLPDGAGDGYFYDPARRRRPGSFFFHFTETAEFVFFPSFEDFLAFVIECYEQGLFRVDGRGKLVEDHDATAELVQEYSVEA
jgi:cell wall assembly regulator SMI1